MAISEELTRYWDIRADPTTIGSLEMSGLEAFKQTIYNIFRTKVGDRGATMRPDWGNWLHLLLHEPINAITAFKIKTFLIEDVRRCQPLAKLDMGKTQVIPLPNSNPPGYKVVIGLLSSPVVLNPTSFSFTAIRS